MGFFWTIVTLVVALGLTWRYLGSYMAAVFDGRVHFLGVGRAADLPAARDQPRAGADLEALRRLAGHLLGGLHGRHLPDHPDPGVAAAQPPAPRRRAARRSASTPPASFVTNTNWQNYGGETTMSYFSQIGALTVQQFVSPAVGHRRRPSPWCGASPRRNSPTIGNFWVDITRCMLYILLPDRLRLRDHLRRPGRGADPGRPGQHPRRPERRHPDHRPGPDRLHGGHQAAGDQRRRVPQRQLGHHLREPDRRSPTGCRSTCCWPSPSPSPTPSARWWAASATARPCWPPWCIIFGVWVGFTSYAEHQGNPAVAAAGRHTRPTGQHRGQGGALRRHHARRCSAWPRPTPRPARPTPPTTRSPRSAASACYRHDARGGDARAARAAGCTRS